MSRLIVNLTVLCAFWGCLEAENPGVDAGQLEGERERHLAHAHRLRQRLAEHARAEPAGGVKVDGEDTACAAARPPGTKTGASARSDGLISWHLGKPSERSTFGRAPLEHRRGHGGRRGRVVAG